MKTGCNKARVGRLSAPGTVCSSRWWFAVALILAMPMNRAMAQIAVDQLSMVFRLTPGQPRLGVINIRNDGVATAQVAITLEDWDRADDGANRFHPLGTVSGSCGSALQVFPPAVSLEAGASQAIRVTIDSTAELRRECWAVAVMERAVAPMTEGTGVSYRMRTATKIYVQPPGLALQAEVGDLKVRGKGVGDDSTAVVEVVVANTGGMHLEGKGVVQVRRTDNTIVQTINLPMAYALPGASMKVRAPFPPLQSGRYVLLALIDYGGAEIAAGQLEHIVP